VVLSSGRERRKVVWNQNAPEKSWTVKSSEARSVSRKERDQHS